MIQEQPNVLQAAFGCPRLCAGKESAFETKNGKMPGDTGEVGHILVVDDDAMVRQTITNFLEDQKVPANSVSCWQDMNIGLTAGRLNVEPVASSIRMARRSG
jgi:hypothetical protein